MREVKHTILYCERFGQLDGIRSGRSGIGIVTFKRSGDGSGACGLAKCYGTSRGVYSGHIGVRRRISECACLGRGQRCSRSSEGIANIHREGPVVIVFAKSDVRYVLGVSFVNLNLGNLCVSRRSNFQCVDGTRGLISISNFVNICVLSSFCFSANGSVANIDILLYALRSPTLANNYDFLNVKIKGWQG